MGALKREACSHCTGDILLELDHDDLLREDALVEVARCVAAGADFVYSDFAEFKDCTWEPNAYRADCGWQSYPTDFQGHGLIAMVAPDVTPHNVRRLEWAPNHLRAWRRSFYDSVPGLSYSSGNEAVVPFTGGHDASLKFADDHDLVLRTYLYGGKIERIPMCLYFYRVHAKQNTNGAVGNKDIQTLDWTVYNRFITRLAERFVDESACPICLGTGQCREHKGDRRSGCFGTGKLLKLDLCGGHNSPQGYIPIDLDFCQEDAPDNLIKADLDKPWPLADNSVGVLRAYDAIEHLSDKVHVMNEAYRVLAPGGIFMIRVPSTKGPGAFCDPTHVSYWNHLSWRYYTDRNFAKYVRAYKGRFQIARAYTEDGAIPYEVCELIALKDGYSPMGAIAI